ncbi:MAG: 1-deoxy-D-xylulose-5-phosphate reductoisomerase [Bacillota bacterium]
MKRIQLLGATGSIGLQTIEIVEEYPESFSLSAITAHQNIDAVMDILKRHASTIETVVIAKKHCDRILDDYPDIDCLALEEDGLSKLVRNDKDSVVLNALVGSVGLSPTLAAIETGKDVLLANKESLVAGGPLIKDALVHSSSALIPIDSEHSALKECMVGRHPRDVERMVITASGGSFRDKKTSELENVTVDDALKHPNWSMGAKITIDSATMMNKVFEVIEAHYLFDIPYERIDAIIHRQSQVHALVQFKDGNVLAHMGPADMRIAILSALQGEKRHRYRTLFDLTKIARLDFEAIDRDRYSLFDLGIAVAKAGGLHPVTMNAANEAAVARFLNREIGFNDIERLIKDALSHFENHKTLSLKTILEHESAVKAYVHSLN